MRILITGTRGFLGSRMVEALSSECTVLAVPGKAAFQETVARHLAGGPVDFVIHAGFDVDFRAAPPGYSPDHSGNAASLRFLLDVAKSTKAVRHFLFLGAAGVFGVSARPTARNEDCFGTTETGFESFLQSRYLQDKIHCQKMLRDAGLRSTTLFLTTTYALDGRSGLLGIPKMTGPFPLAFCPPGGTSYLMWEDFLGALRRVLELRVPGEFILSSGSLPFSELYRSACRSAGVAYRKKVLALPDFTKKLFTAVSRRSKERFLPPLAILQSTYGYKYYSPERIRRTLGWTPRHRLFESRA